MQWLGRHNKIDIGGSRRKNGRALWGTKCLLWTRHSPKHYETKIDAGVRSGSNQGGRHVNKHFPSVRIMKAEGNRELWEHAERPDQLCLAQVGNPKVGGERKLQRCVEIWADTYNIAKESGNKGRIPDRGESICQHLSVTVYISQTMRLVSCVSVTQDGFGKTRIEFTHYLFVTLRNLGVLPVTRKDNEIF